MKITLASLARVALTLIVVIIAAIILFRLVGYYMFAPWTRDGHIRADVVQVAPDVSGLIDRVDVKDNQAVTKGQVLFVVDHARFQLALEQTQAVVALRRATLDQAVREARRNRALGDLVAQEAYEESQSKVQQATANLADAEVAVGVARLNLQRATILSPVDGYLNDRAPRAGEFVSAGRAVLAVVDGASFHVDGYFEETKLPRIAIGQRVDIRIMGQSQLLHGHVASIVAAIEDRDRVQGSNLLPNVNPAFSWVRLAQRIPVRIALDEVPADVRLIAGRTATVSIEGSDRDLNDNIFTRWFTSGDHDDQSKAAGHAGATASGNLSNTGSQVTMAPAVPVTTTSSASGMASNAGAPSPGIAANPPVMSSSTPASPASGIPKVTAVPASMAQGAR